MNNDNGELLLDYDCSLIFCPPFIQSTALPGGEDRPQDTAHARSVRDVPVCCHHDDGPRLIGQSRINIKKMCYGSATTKAK